MDMKKRLISVFTLTAALAIAGAGMAFALAGDPGNDDPNDTDTAGQVSDDVPIYDEGLSDLGDGKVVTSIDDIDPDVCNAIHNINACTPEELEELGLSPVTGSVAEGQSHEEADAQDCGLAGGTVYVTADGEMGCIPHELEDGGVGATPAQPPTVVPEPEVLPSAG